MEPLEPMLNLNDHFVAEYGRLEIRCAELEQELLDGPPKDTDNDLSVQGELENTRRELEESKKQCEEAILAKDNAERNVALLIEKRKTLSSKLTSTQLELKTASAQSREAGKLDPNLRKRIEDLEQENKRLICLNEGLSHRLREKNSEIGKLKHEKMELERRDYTVLASDGDR